MKLLNKLTGKLEEVADTEADAAVLSSGGNLDYPSEQELERGGRLEQYGSTGQQALGALESVARTATFGALPGFGTPEAIAGREKTLREESPGVSFASQALGTLVPGLGATGLTARGLKLAGAGARATKGGSILAEGLAQGTADEVEQARYEERPVSVGNVLLYGVAGELTSRALPAVLRRGAARVVGNDALSAIAGEGAENLAVKAEQRSLQRAAREAPSMPKGPERDALLAKTANEQYDRAAREARQAFDDGTQRFAATDHVSTKALRDLIPANAPVQLRWSGEMVEQLDGLSRSAKGKTREALENVTQSLVDAEKAVDIFGAARAARKTLSTLPESVERDTAMKALREGTERVDLWGKAAQFEQDMGRTVDKWQGAEDFVRRNLAQGDAFDPGKIRSVLQQDKVGRGLVEERAAQLIEAMEDRVQVHRKYNTAGVSVLDSLAKDAEKARAAFRIADDVQAAKIATAKPRGVSAKSGIASGSLGSEFVETGVDMGLAAIGLPPVAGIAMRLMRGISENGRAAISQTARRLVRPLVNEAGAPVRSAVAATALSRFQGEYPGHRESFEAKKELLLSVQQDPTLLATAIAESFGDLPAENPALAVKLAGRIQQATQYVIDNLPPSIATSIVYPRGVPPSESALRDFAILWNSAMDPETVLDDVEDGTAAPAQIRTLQAAHPDIYTDLLQSVVNEVANNFDEMSSQTKQWLDILFDTDGLAGPAFSWRAADMIESAEQEQPQTARSGIDIPADELAPSASGINAIKNGVTNRGA